MNLAAPPPSLQHQTEGLGQSAGTPGFQVEFKRAHGAPISARGSAPNAGSWPITTPDEPKHSGRPMSGRPTAPTSANGRGRAKRETVRGPQAAGFEPNVRSEPGAGRAARANQRRRLAAPERWDRPRPALLFVCRRPREPDHDTRPAGSGAARVRRPRAAGARAEGGRPPAAAEPDRAPAEPCR